MSEVRERIDQSWARLLDTIQSVPEERSEEPGACGEWSIKDLMAHIAYWDDAAVNAAARADAGEAAESTDWQAVNDRVAAQRASWPLDQARQEMHAAHERVVLAVEQYPNLTDPELWAGKTWEHYDEHVDDIRAWLRG